jgi:hypothetical protein
MGLGGGNGDRHDGSGCRDQGDHGYVSIGGLQYDLHRRSTECIAALCSLVRLRGCIALSLSVRALKMHSQAIRVVTRNMNSSWRGLPVRVFLNIAISVDASQGLQHPSVFGKRVSSCQSTMSRR